MSTQTEHLERVRLRIQSLILQYQDIVGFGSTWHADNLRDFVIAGAQVAPGSPDRILRDLRKRRVLNYRLLDRRQSLYQFAPLPAPPQAAPVRPRRRPSPPSSPAQMSLFDAELDEVWLP